MDPSGNHYSITYKLKRHQLMKNGNLNITNIYILNIIKCILNIKAQIYEGRNQFMLASRKVNYYIVYYFLQNNSIFF